MAGEHLQEYFQLFGLSGDATIHEIDKEYHRRCIQLAAQKDPTLGNFDQRQQEYDDAYHKLIQHFIQQECQTMRYVPDSELMHSNVMYHRYDPGIRSAQAGEFNLGRTEEADIRSENAAKLVRQAEEEAYLQKVGSDDGHGEEGDDFAGYRRRSHRRRSRRGSRSPHEPRSALLHLVETQGDIFEAPENSVIVHAVNCLGIWGRGFAAQLRTRFPIAHRMYVEHCRATSPRGNLRGSTILIPPQTGDRIFQGQAQPRFWIACLFTSLGYGSRSYDGINPGRDREDAIVYHTKQALFQLRTGIARVGGLQKGFRPGDLYSPKFNAGNFGVSWEKTEEAIKIAFAGHACTWHIVSSPPTDEGGPDFGK